MPVVGLAGMWVFIALIFFWTVLDLFEPVLVGGRIFIRFGGNPWLRAELKSILFHVSARFLYRHSSMVALPVFCPASQGTIFRPLSPKQPGFSPSSHNSPAANNGRIASNWLF